MDPAANRRASYRKLVESRQFVRESMRSFFTTSSVFLAFFKCQTLVREIPGSIGMAHARLHAVDLSIPSFAGHEAAAGGHLQRYADRSHRR